MAEVQAAKAQAAEAQAAEAQAPKEMTAAQAAKLVFREVQEFDKEGKPDGEPKKVAIKTAEVLGFKDYGTHVVVVTVDGQKFTGTKAAK